MRHLIKKTESRTESIIKKHDHGTGGTVARTGGTVAGTGGTVAGTGGTVAGTGGIV